MRLFLQYLRGKAGKIVAFFLFAVIFIVSFALYHLPLAAVWYPSALCVILGLAVLLLDFRRVKARHETLRLILRQLPTLPDLLPAAHSVPEEDYRALVQALCAQQQALETRMNAQYQDMLDYYTLWAHQIKTPIASMRLCLQQEDTPQARRLLQELSRAEQYVEMVMVYLRLTGGSDLVLREYELDAIVRRAVRRFAGEFIGRKLKLCYEPLNVSCVTDEKWLLFVIEDVSSIGAYLSRMFGGTGVFATQITVYELVRNLVFLTILILASTPAPKKLWYKLYSKGTPWRIVQSVVCAIAFVLCIAYLVDSSYNPFLYFRF